MRFDEKAMSIVMEKKFGDLAISIFGWFIENYGGDVIAEIALESKDFNSGSYQKAAVKRGDPMKIAGGLLVVSRAAYLFRNADKLREFENRYQLPEPYAPHRGKSDAAQ